MMSDIWEMLGNHIFLWSALNQILHSSKYLIECVIWVNAALNQILISYKWCVQSNIALKQMLLKSVGYLKYKYIWYVLPQLPVSILINKVSNEPWTANIVISFSVIFILRCFHSRISSLFSKATWNPLSVCLFSQKLVFRCSPLQLAVHTINTWLVACSEIPTAWISCCYPSRPCGDVKPGVWV